MVGKRGENDILERFPDSRGGARDALDSHHNNRRTLLWRRMANIQSLREPSTKLEAQRALRL